MASEISSTTSLAPLTPNNLGEELITLYVGPKRKKFIVHKKLLVESSDSFKGAFTRDFEEALKGEMILKEDAIGAVSSYIVYLYRSQLPLSHTEQYIHDLQTMDRIQDVAREYQLTHVMSTSSLVQKVFAGVSGITGLPYFCTYFTAQIFALRSTNGNEEKITDCRDEDLKLVLGISKEKHEIFLRFQYNLLRLLATFSTKVAL